MPITDLAPELVRHCLSHLDSNDLRNTSLVCRDWLEPSMEFYWAEADLYPYLDGNVLKDLDTLLGSNSHIPRTLRGLVIDESEVENDDDDEEDEEIVQRKQWIEGLSKILGHFTCIKRLTIGALDLTRFPRDIRRRLLNNISVSETLVIRYLKVAELSDITSFIFDNPQLRFLGLGSIEIAKPQDGEKMAEDGGEKTAKEDGDGASNDKDLNLLEDDHVVKLPKLKHLVSFTPSPIVWTKILPRLKGSVVEGLRTIVTVCKDPKVVSELVETAGPSLLSLAIGMYQEGCRFDLSTTQSLVNLSFDLSSYPQKEALLSDLHYTLTHVANPKCIFINTGPGLCEADMQHESAPPLWEALDAHLADMEGLEQVTFTQVISGCLAGIMGIPGAGNGGLFDQFRGQLEDTVNGLLPRCKEKGIITIKQILGAWTSSAFAGVDMPEE
ncbi:hypothetical protein V8F33_014089 [Rhypophila sp. PSN 637]